MTVTARTGSRPRRGSRWWHWPWLFPLGFVVVAFLAFSLPPYLGLDVSSSRVPPPQGMGWYYPTLVTHIGFSTIAMTTCVLQLWPWLRRRHPVVHRRIGRAYVFAGAVPGSITGFLVAIAAPFGPVAAVSSALLAPLWLGCTVAGYREARAGRYAEHRRWMIRSAVLCLSIITNRIWGIVWILALGSQVPTTFGGDEAAFGQTISGLTTWMGWVIPLLIAEYVLDRERRPAT